MEAYIINGEAYGFTDQVRDNAAVKAGFNTLARLIYDFDFEPWSAAGYWDNYYRSQVLLHQGKVVAAASANAIHLRFNHRFRLYIQIGTVMTHPDYRGRGLSRWLLEHILARWRERCDGIYLFANNRVLDFYPKFGFIQANEYKHTRPAPAPGRRVRARKLDMVCAAHRELLLKTYTYGNPYTHLAMENNPGLLMFYCLGEMRDQVWYIDAYDTVVVAAFVGETLACHDIFGKGAVPLQDVLKAVVTPHERRVVFGFTPIDQRGCRADLLKAKDATFFILDGKENLFKDNKLMLPLLAHA